MTIICLFGESEVATTPGAVGSEPVRVSGPGSGVSVGLGRLGRVQALAAIGDRGCVDGGVVDGVAVTGWSGGGLRRCG